MRFLLTRHARDVMEERVIPLDWVRRIVDTPERIEPDAEDPALEHRLGHIPEHGHRVLRIVLNRKARPARIVTVYFDRAMRGKL